MTYRLETYETVEVEEGVFESYLVKTEERPLTPGEILQDVIIKRKTEYIKKGWETPWNLMDDILAQLKAQGITLQAGTERDQIKTDNPKPL